MRDRGSRSRTVRLCAGYHAALQRVRPAQRDDLLTRLDEVHGRASQRLLDLIDEAERTAVQRRAVEGAVEVVHALLTGNPVPSTMVTKPHRALIGGSSRSAGPGLDTERYRETVCAGC